MRPKRGAEAGPAILMMAYTNYESDPRVMRAAEAAAESNFSVDVLVLRRPGQPLVESIRGVRVLRLGQERYRGASHIKYLMAYLEFILRCAVTSTRLFVRRRYKVIHVNNMPDILVFSTIIPKLLGAKVILDIHDPMPETFGAKFDTVDRTAVGRILLWLERLSVAFANATITVSEPVKNGILVKHGHRPETIGVIANFADERLFTVMAYPSIVGVVRFVFHGTIVERSGLRTLIEAIASLRNTERIRIRIIGEGDFSANLRSLITSHGLGDVVEFVNRVFPLQEIPRVLSDCHVGLVPLQMSKIADFALPLKLIEYMSLGIPCISVRNSAIEYYVRPDECMFFEPGDAKHLAELIDGVAENPERLFEYRRKLGPARERLSWGREKQKYTAMLSDLAGYSLAREEGELIHTDRREDRPPSG